MLKFDTSCLLSAFVRSVGSKSAFGIGHLKGQPGSRPKRTRLGRGEGSGSGKQASRGHRGSGQYGTRGRLGWEGGQFPFYLKPRYWGALPPPHAYRYKELNLTTLRRLVEKNRLPTTRNVTMADLLRMGVVSSLKDGVVLLGTGKETFDRPVTIEVSKATPASVEAVRKCGGNVICVYMQKDTLHKYCKYFKTNPGRTEEDFLRELPRPRGRAMGQLRRRLNVITPVEVPPSHLLGRYCDNTVGGFMSFVRDRNPRPVLDPRLIPFYKPKPTV